MSKKEPKLSAHATRVLELLQKEKKPLTAYAILDRLRRHGFRAPPTVYRALDALVRGGYAHKLESLNAFVACCHEGAHEAHISPIAICTSCGKVEEIDSKALQRQLKAISRGFLASLSTKPVELTGLCHACKEKG